MRGGRGRPQSWAHRHKAVLDEQSWDHLDHLVAGAVCNPANPLAQLAKLLLGVLATMTDCPPISPFFLVTFVLPSHPSYLKMMPTDLHMEQRKPLPQRHG